MAKQVKMNQAQAELIGKFFNNVGWSPETAEAEKKELQEKVASLRETLKATEAQLSGFDGRTERASEALVMFQGMFSDSTEQQCLDFLYSRFSVKPRKTGETGTGPKVKASEEEKELLLGHLDRDGRTVSQIVAEINEAIEKANKKAPDGEKQELLDTKDAARILKAMIQDGAVRTSGQKRGTMYHLEMEQIEDDTDEEDEAEA
jgi:hypothetical protein